MSNSATTIDNSYYNRSRRHGLNIVSDGDIRCEIRPNGSSNRRALLFCVSVLALVNGGMGIMFFALGAWPVLPFAGLEALLVIVAGFSVLRSERVEFLALSGNCLHLTICQGKRRTVRSFSRYWTEVRLMTSHSGHGRNKLILVSHGRVQEIGRELLDCRKTDLHRQLTDYLSRPN